MFANGIAVCSWGSSFVFLIQDVLLFKVFGFVLGFILFYGKPDGFVVFGVATVTDLFD